MSLYECVHVSTILEDTRGLYLNHLKIEFHVVMSYVKWVLRTKFIFSRTVESSLKLKYLSMPNYYDNKSHWYTYSSYLPCQIIAWVYFERADLVPSLRRTKRTAKCQLNIKFFVIYLVSFFFSLLFHPSIMWTLCQ